MASPGFPKDDYTPHGYLANPFAVARSWSEGRGGNLRSIDEGIGFGWLYPWARGATAGAAIQIALRHDRQLFIARRHFEALRLTSPHHSSNLFEYSWALRGLECAARFVLVGEDELGLEVELHGGAKAAGAPSPLPEGVEPPLPRGEGWGEGLALCVLLVGWRTGGDLRPGTPGVTSHYGAVELGSPFGTHQLFIDAGAVPTRGLGTAEYARNLMTQDPSHVPARSGPYSVVGGAVLIPEGSGTDVRVVAALRRRVESPVLRTGAGPPAVSVPAAVGRARELDDKFWSGAARLEGDWPASWRRGWVYDLETTRMCIFPAGGVFRDPWPSWMIQWPRVVLAEGSLDALRLSYGDPSLAQTVALAMLRDASAPNVPCVFQHGEPNMVAKDGSICGTSPAWCVPFYNLERLYLRTLDRGWLARVYEPLARYLRWWLRERTDRLGWAVYKCTWEAGEDDTPRLDPERRGDNVVSEYVRPVELQATMALSAGVLARFATDLGRRDDAAHWAAVARSFGDRAQQLWDPREQRFRDWDARRDDFLQPSGEPNYWGIDPCRHSVLSLTPLLANIATPGQIAALAREIAEYARPPWTLWPSWSYVLLESAMAAGQRELAGRVAANIVGRVYDELDRRTLDEPRGPTPGVAREYWPLDMAGWDACEGYGWGATTASLLVRQIFGFLESQDTSGVRFRLAPWLPDELLEPGSTYAVVNIPYRGHALNVEYSVPEDFVSRHGARRSIRVAIAARDPSNCQVIDAHGNCRDASRADVFRHRFGAELGSTYDVTLDFG